MLRPNAHEASANNLRSTRVDGRQRPHRSSAREKGSADRPCRRCEVPGRAMLQIWVRFGTIVAAADYPIRRARRRPSGLRVEATGLGLEDDVAPEANPVIDLSHGGVRRFI
jgi:hypothetical protein